MEEIVRLNSFSDRRNESKNETTSIYRNKGNNLLLKKYGTFTAKFVLCAV